MFDSPEACLKILHPLIASEQFEAAFALCLEACTVYPQAPQLAEVLGYLRLVRQEKAAAEVEFLRAVALFTGQPVAQEACLRRILLLWPAAPRILTALARIYLARGDRAALAALMAPYLPCPGAPEFNQTDPVLIYPYEFAHQLAQLRYLREQGYVPESYERLYQQWQSAYHSVRDRPLFEACQLRFAGARWLKCAFYEYPLPSFERLLNPHVDFSALEADFFASGVLVIEALLAPAVLAEFYQYLLCSTLWHEPYPTGYLGCSWRTGFYPAFLFQLAHELAEALPRIFAPHPLRNFWAFRSDWRSLRPGIHGDQAAINFNLWLTPTEANRDLDSGGLVLYDAPVPPDWDFAYYNQPQHLEQIQTFLHARQASAHRIPYRQNRAVIFRSDLLHEVDQLRFRPGFLNARTTLVMLFGERV